MTEEKVLNDLAQLTKMPWWTEGLLAFSWERPLVERILKKKRIVQNTEDWRRALQIIERYDVHVPVRPGAEWKRK